MSSSLTTKQSSNAQEKRFNNEEVILIKEKIQKQQQQQNNISTACNPQHNLSKEEATLTKPKISFDDNDDDDHRDVMNNDMFGNDHAPASALRKITHNPYSIMKVQPKQRKQPPSYVLFPPPPRSPSSCLFETTLLRRLNTIETYLENNKQRVVYSAPLHTKSHFTPWPAQATLDGIYEEIFQGNDHTNFITEHEPSGRYAQIFVGCANKYCTFEQFFFILALFAGVQLLGFRIGTQRNNNNNTSLADTCYLTVAAEAADHVVRVLHRCVLLDCTGVIHATPLTGTNLQKYDKNDLLLERFVVSNFCSAMNNARNQRKHPDCPESLANAIVYKCPRDVLTFTHAGSPGATPQENHKDKVEFENKHSPTCPCDDCREYYFVAKEGHHHYDRRAERVQELFRQYETELIKHTDPDSFARKIPTHLTHHPLSENIDGAKKMLREANGKNRQFFAELEQRHHQNSQNDDNNNNEELPLLPDGYGLFLPGRGLLFPRLPLSRENLRNNPDDFILYLKDRLLPASPRLYDLLPQDYYNWQKYSISNENLQRLLNAYKNQTLTSTSNGNNNNLLATNTICRSCGDSYHQRLVRFFKFHAPQNDKYQGYDFIIEVLKLFKGREEYMFPLFEQCGCHEEPPLLPN